MKNYKYWIAGIVTMVCVITLLVAQTGMGSPPLENKQKKAKFANRQTKQGKLYTQALNDYDKAIRLKKERFAQMRKRREDSLQAIARNYGSYGGSYYGGNNEDKSVEYEVYYTPSGESKLRRVRRKTRGYYSHSGGGYYEDDQNKRSKTGVIRGQTSRSFRGGSRRGGK